MDIALKLVEGASGATTNGGYRSTEDHLVSQTLACLAHSRSFRSHVFC
jgi:hypothetical protein